MALSKQNRVIGTVAIFFLAATGYVFSKYERVDVKAEKDKAFSIEKVKVREETPVEVIKNLKENFKLLIIEVNSCLKLQIQNSEPRSDSLLNDLLDTLSGEFGEPSAQVDRWNSWRLIMPDGKEKEYRLEVVESDDGKVRRELYAFVFDQSGALIPVELEKDLALNPNVDQLSALLNEGQVITKGKAGSSLYSGGERLDFVETNGELKEIELSKLNQTLKCTSLEMRNLCQCLN